MIRRFAPIIAALAAVLMMLAAPPRAAAHDLKGHPDPIDALLANETAKDFTGGFFSSTQLDSGTTGALVTLKPGGDGKFPPRGYYESTEIEPGFLFQEVLPSWNIDLPSGTGYVIQLSVRGQTGGWSSWYYLGGYKAVWDIPFNKYKTNVHGRVDVDHWVGNAPVRFIKYRVWLFSVNAARTPALRRFFLHARGYPEANPGYKAADPSSGGLPAKAALDVPWRSQMALGREIRGETCCPTSVAMILELNGHDRITTDVAKLVYDNEARIYGVWPRAAQVLSQFGLRAYVGRFRNLDEARRVLASGQPIIASIKAREGQLPNAPYRRSNGHILVIIGYDATGFIINDPATIDPARGRGVHYTNEGMQAAWLDNGGVAIIAHKPQPAAPTPAAH